MYYLFFSDEGDTSDSSSEELKIGRETRLLLDLETPVDYNSQYLSVPPPSPQFPKFKNLNKERKSRKKDKMEENHYMRRKLLVKKNIITISKKR